MDKIGKTFALALTLIIVMSCLTLLTVKPANAQTIPKPSVPEFMLRYVDKSFNLPPTYEIDSYTGKNVTIQSGGYIQNRSIQLTLINPPFNQFRDDNGNKVNMYYNVSVKSHFTNDWQYYYFSRDMYSLNLTYFEVLSSRLTELVFGFGSDNGSGIYNLRLYSNAADSQIDFRVQTYFGYESIVENPNPYAPFSDHSRFIRILNVTQTADWSNIQTINLVDGSVSASSSPSQPPTLSPIVPESTPTLTTNVVYYLIPLSVIVAVVLSCIVLFSRHRKPRLLSNTDVGP